MNNFKDVMIEKFSIKELEFLINKKKKEIYNTKLSIAKKDLINKKLDIIVSNR